MQRRVQEPHNIYDGALCNNCEQLKAVDYYGEVPHLGMAGFMDQSLTINRDCWNICLFFLFKDYQHNNQRILKENQAQIQMTYTILIEKLNSSFYHT